MISTLYVLQFQTFSAFLDEISFPEHLEEDVVENLMSNSTELSCAAFV